MTYFNCSWSVVLRECPHGSPLISLFSISIFKKVFDIILLERATSNVYRLVCIKQEEVENYDTKTWTLLIDNIRCLSSVYPQIQGPSPVGWYHLSVEGIGLHCILQVWPHYVTVRRGKRAFFDLSKNSVYPAALCQIAATPGVCNVNQCLDTASWH